MPGLGRLIEQLLRLGGGHRQRLVGHDVLALGDRGGVDRVVQVVRRRVVDDLDVGIVQQRLVAPVGLARAERFRLFLRRRLAAARDRHDVDVAETPHGVDVMRSDEARPDDSHTDPFHVASPPMREENGRRSILHECREETEVTGSQRRNEANGDERRVPRCRCQGRVSRRVATSFARAKGRRDRCRPEATGGGTPVCALGGPP